MIGIASALQCYQMTTRIDYEITKETRTNSLRRHDYHIMLLIWRVVGVVGVDWN